MQIGRKEVKQMKRKSIFWGILFILTAVFIVVSKLGYLQDVSLVKIIFAAIFVGLIISSLVRLWWVGVLFPAAFICIIFSEELGLTNLTPWPVLAIALLGSIGLSLIFSPIKKNKNKSCNYHDGFSETIEEESGDVVECYMKYGSSVKYIKSENFQKAVVKCSFGAMKVYFDNAKIPSGRAEVTLEVSFAGVELFIPREWNVINEVDAMLGGIDEKGKMLSSDGPTLVINGSVSLAGVEIHYI